MKTAKTGIYLDLLLSKHLNADPLSEQLYDQIKDLVIKGFVAPGDWLPPSRQLADKLGIGRNTVVHAYHRLVQEGFATSTVGKGTQICGAVHTNLSSLTKKVDFFSCPPPRMKLNPVAITAKEAYSEGVDPELPFSLTSPDLQTLPDKKWVQLVTRCQKIPWRHNGNTPPEGIPDYRQAVAKVLRERRGVSCDYRQVVATSNIRQGLALCAQLLFNPGDTIAIEDPSYRVHQELFRFYGIKVVPIPVGDDGMDLKYLFALSQAPKAVLITPHNQFPTTAVMPSASRKALAEWASFNNCWVIEDDYDGLISYDDYPEPAFASHDRHWSNTVLLGSFSRSIYPGFKLGYLVVNRALVPAFSGARLFSDRQCCENHEVVLAQFIQEGGFESHLRKLKKILSSRKSALLSAMEAELKFLGTWKVPRGGGHVCFEFFKEMPDVKISEFLKENYRLICRPLSRQYITKEKKYGFILGFAGFSEEALARSVQNLKRGVMEFLENSNF